MRLRTELALAVLGFVVLDLVLAAAAIALFARMGPAVDDILRRHDASIAACEDLLSVLAGTDRADAPSQDPRVTSALERLAEHADGPGEPALVAELSDLVTEPLDEANHGRAVTALLDLIGRNRRAMQDADLVARRLGRAGAWAAAAVGLAALLLGVVLANRLARRVVRPILELQRVLVATRRGDRYRRCTVASAPEEIREALTQLNHLLDREQADRADADAVRIGQPAAGELPGADPDD